MARIRDVEIDEVPEDTRAIYEKYGTEYGPFLNQVKVFAHRPPVLKHMMGMLMELSAEHVLPKRYLEIALVTVSKINECKYCVAHHTPRAVEHGIDPEACRLILEDSVPGFDATDMLVRDYAVQVTNNFQYIRNEIFDRLKQHFSDEQIFELTTRTALCGFFNRVNDSLQIGMEDGAITDMLSAGARESDLPSPSKETP